MCHPAYYPPYDKACGHPDGVWCACEKYRSTDATKHLGNQPEDGESGVLRAADAAGGYPRTLTLRKAGGLDLSDDGEYRDAGRGEFDSDSILTF